MRGPPPPETIARVAEALLASGLIYICVWGPECERVHDIFDAAHSGDGSFEPAFSLMSTWHSDETLEEALWYFVDAAFPSDMEVAATTFLAITVGKSDWATTVSDVFLDLAAFNSRILDDQSPSSGNARPKHSN